MSIKTENEAMCPAHRKFYNSWTMLHFYTHSAHLHCHKPEPALLFVLSLTFSVN